MRELKKICETENRYFHYYLLFLWILVLDLVYIYCREKTENPEPINTDARKYDKYYEHRNEN